MTPITAIPPIAITKDFPVSASRLYAAWTEEEQLKKWWRPMEDSLKSAIAELKTGGEINYLFAGDKFRVNGKYDAVVPGKELAYSWNWSFTDQSVNSESFKLKIGFENNNGKTTLRVFQDGFRDEDERKAHEEGWKTGLKQLEDFLKTD